MIWYKECLKKIEMKIKLVKVFTWWVCKGVEIGEI